jgi:hypothetical protein
MTATDLETFSARLVTLAELFEAPLSESKIWLYFEALADLPAERVMAACVDAARRYRFMPKPAELRTLAVGDQEEAIEAAWMAFRHAMRVVGSYASLVVADPVLGETIVAMFQSWPAACVAELSAEMWTAKRKEFGRVYRTIASRGMVGSRYLLGLCEQQNAGKPEWLAYVPVKRLAGNAIEALTVEQADHARTQIAATAHGFRQLADCAGSLDVADPAETTS